MPGACRSDVIYRCFKCNHYYVKAYSNSTIIQEWIVNNDYSLFFQEGAAELIKKKHLSIFNGPYNDSEVIKTFTLLPELTPAIANEWLNKLKTYSLID